jgi:hypothetical protein
MAKLFKESNSKLLFISSLNSASIALAAGCLTLNHVYLQHNSD